VTGRHRPNGRRSRVLLIVAAAVVVAALGVVAVRVVVGSGNCGTGVRLTIATAADIAPAVSDAAARWSRDDGKCVRTRVVATAPADLAGGLAARAGGRLPNGATAAPTPDEATVPAVWLPDSSSWLLRVQSVNRAAFDAEAPSIATSPVVLGVGDQILKAVPGGGARPVTTADLSAMISRLASGAAGSGGTAGAASGASGAPPDRMGLVEPRRDTAGLVGALLLRTAVASNPNQLPALVAAYRRLAITGDRTTLLQNFRAGTVVATMSEQAVLAHAVEGPGAPVTAVPLADALTLDYPYAVLGGQSRAVHDAALRFRAALIGGRYRGSFTALGFRAPDGTAGAGFPTGHGVRADRAVPRPLTDEARITDVLNLWTGAVSPSRLMTLMDVTASMRAGGKIDILRTAAIDGLGLFTDDSEIGLWEFADGLGNRGEPYRPVVNLNQLSLGQRTALRDALVAAQPAATDVAGLYDTILAAYQEVQARWRADASNTVLVFTDGGNTRPGRSLADTLRELERLTDVTRPIRVVLLGIGAGIKLAELNEIAQVTGGKAFQITDPAQITGIFLRALLRV
jgi:Ca-activated chloride channel family protein